MHVDGREHVLKHGSHQFDVHALRPEIVQHQQRMVSKLLLVHPVPLQRRNHVFDQGVLGRRKENK